MNERRWLQSLSRFFLGQALRSQASKLVIYQGEQLGRRVWIAGFDRGQNAGDLAHLVKDKHTVDRKQTK